MTAYVRISLNVPTAYYTVEIQTLNKKFFEINISLPPELLSFEGEIRKWVSAVAERGCFSVRITAHFTGVNPITISANLPLVRQLGQVYKSVAQELGVSLDSLAPHLIANEKNLFTTQHHSETFDAIQHDLRIAVDQALSDLIKMKRNEGDQLEADILSRAHNLNQIIDSIANSSTDSVSKYEKKLKERLQQLVPQCVDNDDRLLRELLLYAEKVDISEEIVRFRSHLKQFHEVIASETISKGKTLEFLIQELGREINTIGSKLPEMTRYVVQVKAELDRVREQLQNVE